MQNTNEKLINDINNNFRFVITISIFFLGIINDIKFTGCILIVIYILNYIIFYIRRNKYSERNLKWIITSIFIGIGSYIIPLFVIALSTQNKVISPFELYTYQSAITVSIFITLAAPIACFVMLCLLGNQKS